MKTLPVSDDIDDAVARLPAEFYLLIGKLRMMVKGGLVTDDELARFFALAEPAQKAAQEAEEALARAAGRIATDEEMRAAGVKALLAEAPRAASDVWGAAIGEFFGGDRAQ